MTKMKISVAIDKNIKNPVEYFKTNKEFLEYFIKEEGDFKSICSFKIRDKKLRVAGLLFKILDENVFRKMLELVESDDFIEKLKTLNVLPYQALDIKESLVQLKNVTVYDYEKLN